MKRRKRKTRVRSESQEVQHNDYNGDEKMWMKINNRYRKVGVAIEGEFGVERQGERREGEDEKEEEEEE